MMEVGAGAEADAASKGKHDMAISVPPQGKPFSLWLDKYHLLVTAVLGHARSNFVECARNLAMDGPTHSTLQSKTPKENHTSVFYSFAFDSILREEYRNPWHSIRIDKLLEDLDTLAGTIAVKHCSDSDRTTRPLLLVTTSVDKISMKKVLRVDVDLQLARAVAWVGRLSMEIRMEVIQLVREVMEKDNVALIANFTFVARDWKT